MDYRQTVFLPSTGFAMRGDLPKKEPQILARWHAMDLWAATRAASTDRPPFILHDGPPYANGHLHIGHALNKILKDVVNRSRQMAGFDANYIPGWDCHGLPIEWQIEESYRKSGRSKDDVPVLQLRRECREHAQRWMDIQAEEFRRLGVQGNWAGRYATMDFASEAAIANELGKFLLNGALYRGLRPVMWSTVEKTALAEAEIEYHDHTSTTIFVRFPLTSAAAPDLIGANIIIWTTTPWTMPGNRAIAYGADFDYALIHIDSTTPDAGAYPGERLLVALPLLPSLLTTGGIATHHIIRILKGSELVSSVAAHPLRGHGYDYDVPLLAGDFVTTEQGTGFVHMAPGHGEEDFQLCRTHNIEIPDTVADNGTYNPWVPLFAGKHIFKVTDEICEALISTRSLLARGKLLHSYPHSWRSKAPLIYRATPQWFIRLDGPEHIREKALAAIDATLFVPDAGRRRIGSMIENRPDWCISRQRAWGVPIPVFVDRRTGEPLRDPDVVARIVAAFTVEGADAWYASPPSRFLGNDYNADHYEQAMDIVDVWFESGSSHAFVLEARSLPWPADLYLEGSDQHRGWFNSSLLEAVGTRGVAPFKAVLTHGFVLDEQGRKMSKSLGNVTAPQQVTDTLGADILRLWVMSSDTSEDLRIGPEILKQQSELYRRLRNTLRWILGSLDGYSPTESISALPELERLMLHHLFLLNATLQTAIQTYDWTGVYPAIHAFCSTDLSAFYFDIRKDALYCDRPNSLRRRAARTTLDHLHRCLTLWLAPVLVFTAEEAWTARFGDASSVHLETFPTLPPTWRDDALAARWARIREIRRIATAELETMRKDGRIGASLQAQVILHLPPADIALLSEADWAEVLIVSSARVTESESPRIETGLADGRKCARCWRVLTEVGHHADHPTLCLRCTDAVVS